MGRFIPDQEPITFYKTSDELPPGFDIGERVDKGEFGQPPARGGWLYRCDGMPTMRGCPSEIVVPRRWTRVDKKAGSGWLVCYGQDFDGTEDTDVVLTFCPSCALVAAAASPTPEDGKPE